MTLLYYNIVIQPLNYHILVLSHEAALLFQEKKSLSREIAVFLKMSTFIFFPLTHLIRRALKVRKNHELLTYRTQFFGQETIN